MERILEHELPLIIHKFTYRTIFLNIIICANLFNEFLIRVIRVIIRCIIFIQRCSSPLRGSCSKKNIRVIRSIRVQKKEFLGADGYKKALKK